MGYLVFISHTNDTRPFVDSVAFELRRRGVEPVLADELRLDADRLSDSLHSASVFVVFISRPIDSPWVNFEVGAAIGQSKPIVPVFLNDHARAASPGILRTLEGIDASDLKPEQVADKIADTLAAAA